MATATFNGSVRDALSLNSSRSVSLSKYGTISGVVSSLWATLNFSTTAYSKYYDVEVTLYYSGGSISTSDTVKMDSSNYTNGEFDFYFDNISAAQANSIYSMSVYCSGDDGSRIFLKGSQYVYCEYTIPTRCGAPTSAALSAAATTAATNTLSWSGASGGTVNAIKGYYIQYSESSNGQTWDGWHDGYTISTSATSYSMSVNMPDVGKYRKFKVWTQGQAGYDYDSATGTETAATYRAYTPAAPTGLSPAAGGYSSVTNISWAAVSCNDQVTSYQYQISTDDGSSWGQTLSVNTTSANIASTFSSAPASARFKFRVRAVTNRGISSAWATSGTFYRTIGVPSITSPSAGHYETAPVLSWSKSTDSGIAGYQYQISTNGGGSYGEARTTTGTTGTFPEFASAARGTAFCFRVRVYTSSNVYSGWAISAVFYKNTAISAPTVAAPVTGRTIRAFNLRIIVSVAAKSNGITQTLYYKWKSGDNWATLASNTAGAFKRILTSPISSNGTINLFLRLTDAAGAAVEASAAFTVVRPSFTDETLVPGSTPTKAVHVNEIREIVDSLRAAYGLSVTAWSETIAAGTTSLRHYNEHVREIRSGIAAVVSQINSLAGQTIVNAPASWCALAENGPKAEAITEIRNAIKGI